MKTRTLLLLSVGTALMILVAGGALLWQLSSQESSAPTTPIGEQVSVGDAQVTVTSSDRVGDLLEVTVIIGGVDDPDGIDTFRLVTGDRRLEPLGARGTDADGRCQEIVTEPVECVVAFDVGASDGSSRVLVMRRGEAQSTWRLAGVALSRTPVWLLGGHF